ncbi:MAG TPA: hypothetical protein VEK11_11340 [Thermoanaerobaculia bacterium]|nr:hypothetical protein [Thermoanaerobaculia bacterium]
MAAKTTTKKKATSVRGGTGAAVLRSVVGGGAGADTILDLIERLGLVDIVLGRVKSKIEETDIDDLLDEVQDYLRRNPEVLVVSLAAVTIATGLLVWLNSRREWDGNERRGTGAGAGTTGTGRARTSSAPGRIKRTTPAPLDDDETDD